LAAYRELVGDYPAVEKELGALIFPEVEVDCPAGHRLHVLAGLLAAGREVFCPRCRKAFNPSPPGAPAPAPADRAEPPRTSGEPSGEPAAPPAEGAGEPAAKPAAPARRRWRRRKRLLGRRAWRRITGAGGWMISFIIHGVLLLVAMLMGIRVVAGTRKPPELAIETTVKPPDEHEMFQTGACRDILRKPSEQRGAESADIQKLRAIAELQGRESEEISERLSPELSDRDLSERLERLEAPASALTPAADRSAANPRGMGVSVPLPTGSFRPGVTSGLGPGLMAMRGEAAGRLAAARHFGGGADTERAVAMALKWLAARQHSGGSWAARPGRAASAADNCELATTAIALLAFLGAGYGPAKGQYRNCVAGALQWLISNQQENGSWRTLGAGQRMHSQGMATLALAEACMLAGRWGGAARLREAAQEAVDFVERAQVSTHTAWGYNPRSTHIEQSVVIWNGMALKAARTARLDVSGLAMMGMAQWLEDGSAPGGRYSYRGSYNPARRRTRGDGGNGSPTMVAAALMMRMWTGTAPGEKETRESGDIVLGQLRELARSGNVDLYFTHHGTIGLFQMGGDQWREWNPMMKKLVLGTQFVDGHWNGFQNDVMSTALGALILESYYRYSPLYCVDRRAPAACGARPLPERDPYADIDALGRDLRGKD
jgi:hypothetical protein